MLARNYLNSYLFAFETTLPEQRFRDWMRVNDEVIVEAAAVTTADFLSEVEDPSDAELKKFYEEHKEIVPSPDFIDGAELPTSTPGFATPRRVVIQYAKVDLASQVDKLLDTVTDEEIENYYNENKQQFIRSDDLIGEGLLEADPAEEDSAAGDSANEEPADVDSAEGDAADTTEDAAAKTNAEETDAAETDAEESDAAEAEPAETDSGKATRSSLFRFVALQEEPEQEDSEQDNSETDAPDESERNDADSETSEESESSLSPSEMLFGPGSDSADTAADDSADADSDGGRGAAGDKPAEDKPVEYQSLDEVRDDIRRRLAEKKALDNQVEFVTGLAAPLKKAYVDYELAVMDASETEGGKEGEAKAPQIDPPAELKQLEAFAEKKQSRVRPNGRPYAARTPRQHDRPDGRPNAA